MSHIIGLLSSAMKCIILVNFWFVWPAGRRSRSKRYREFFILAIGQIFVSCMESSRDEVWCCWCCLFDWIKVGYPFCVLLLIPSTQFLLFILGCRLLFSVIYFVFFLFFVRSFVFWCSSSTDQIYGYICSECPIWCLWMSLSGICSPDYFVSITLNAILRVVGRKEYED